MLAHHQRKLPPMFTVLALSCVLGFLLSKVIPTGQVSGERYTAPTEAQFQLLLKAKGLA